MRRARALGLKVGLEASRCPRVKVKNASCKFCLEVCPTHAIALSPAPTVAWSECTGCGACAAVCPTGAFELLESPVPHPAEEGTLWLACAAVNAPQASQLPCLAASSAALLAGPLSRGVRVVKLSFGDCQRCLNGPAMMARGNLRDWIFTLCRLLGVSVDLVEDRTANFLESMVPGVPRRFILQWFARKAERKESPLWRENVEAPGLAVGTVRRVGDCYLCPACIAACTAEALKVEDMKLIFAGERCNGCGACADACGFSSLAVAPVFSRDETVLAEARPFVCVACGEEAVGTGQICQRCQWEKRTCGALSG